MIYPPAAGSDVGGALWQHARVIAVEREQPADGGEFRVAAAVLRIGDGLRLHLDGGGDTLETPSEILSKAVEPLSEVLLGPLEHLPLIRIVVPAAPVGRAQRHCPAVRARRFAVAGLRHHAGSSV